MGKVVVVGSTNTDMTVRVPAIPAPGETVLGHSFRVTGGGKGANQAVAAARAGGTVVFVTAVGTDAFGDAALDTLRREGIDIRFARRVSSAASGVALIFVDDRGENSIAVAPGANAALIPEDVEPLASVVEPDAVVLLQLEIPIAVVEAAVRITAARNARVVLNPAPAQPLPKELLASVAMITPNEREAAQLTGGGVEEDGGVERAAAELHRRGVRDVLITLGARGVLVSSEGSMELVPPFAVRAVDTTAAGDVFNGALAAALVEGRPLRAAVRFANAAAALSVTRAGAQTSAPLRTEIDSLLADGARSVS